MDEDRPIHPAPTHTKRRKKQHPAWLQATLFSLVRGGAGLINAAGPEASMRAMRRLGAFYATLPFNARRLARANENLAMCFPEWREDVRRDHAVEAYRHLFCLAAELALVPRLLNEDAFARHVVLGTLAKGLQSLASDRPCILITGHCGNWELLGTTLAMLGFRMHALYRPLDLPPLDAWLHETRSRKGVTLVDKFGAAEILPAVLERRTPVGFIADQNAGDRGIFVPFFNRLASAYKTIGLLAIKYDATIICGQARRLSGLSFESEAARGASPRSLLAHTEHAEDLGSFRYRIDVTDVFGPDDWRDAPDPLFYITARYRRAIELMVRRAPEQYLWMHRYWKSRPPHEKRGKPFPGQLREKIASLPWIDDDDVAQIMDRSALDARLLRAT